MSEKKKNHCHRSETRKIKCTVSGCGIDIWEKNYQQHLIDKHPHENSCDLSGHGQKKLSSFFNIPKPPDQSLKRPANEQPCDSPNNKANKQSQETTENCITDTDNAFCANDDNTEQRNQRQSSDNKNNNTNIPLQHATSDNPLCISSCGSVSHVTLTANLEKITEDISCIKQNVEKLVEFNVVERSRISKPSPNIKNVEIMNEEMETLDATVCLARSLKDIESVGFRYEEKEELRFSVCTTEGSHMDHANNTNNFSANGIFK